MSTRSTMIAIVSASILLAAPIAQAGSGSSPKAGGVSGDGGTSEGTPGASSAKVPETNSARTSSDLATGTGQATANTTKTGGSVGGNPSRN